MELIPDWAPNIHPMIVHFPIAFVLGAIGADLLSLVVRRWAWLRPATVALYVIGGASAVLTYIIPSAPNRCADPEGSARPINGNRKVDFASISMQGRPAGRPYINGSEQ